MYTLLCQRTLLLAYLLSTPAELMPNARHEPLPEAGAQRTLEAVGSMPLFGSGYDSQKRLIEFPVNTTGLE
jgi:hypothetical protein